MFAPAFGRPAMDGVYWSIMLEIVFYGWFTALMLAGIYQRRKLAIIAAWLAISAGNEFFLESGALRVLFITAYSPFFASGILAYHLIAKGRSPELLALLATSFLLSLKVIVFSQSWMLAHFGVAIPYPRLIAADIAVHGIFAGAILLRSVIPPSPTILMLGGLTYPLYLLHQFIGYILLNELAPRIGKEAAFIGVVSGMLIASFVVWRFVETPIRKPLVQRLTSIVNRLASIWPSQGQVIQTRQLGAVSASEQLGCAEHRPVPARTVEL